MSHEVATPKKRKDGTYVNVYGAGTPKAGEPLPNSGTFSSKEEADQAGRIRSIMSGRPTDILTPDAKEINFGAVIKSLSDEEYDDVMRRAAGGSRTFSRKEIARGYRKL